MKRSRKFWIIGSSVFLLCLLAFTTYRIMTANTFQFFGHITAHVQMNEKVVALTMDDGPSDRTDAILAILDRTGIKATFYLIGSNLESNPEPGKHIAERGHEIGNHTYSHKWNVFRSPQFLISEVTRTNELIRQTGYQGPITFRPSYGKKLILLPYIVNRLHMETMMWDVEPDSLYKESYEMSDYVIANAMPGSIILLHPMHNQKMLDALEDAITGLQRQGYRFVTVSELLAMKE